eukprot:scaffold1899_cov70-Skeletonema_menzelii.AAC.4
MAPRYILIGPTPIAFSALISPHGFTKLYPHRTYSNSTLRLNLSPHGFTMLYPHRTYSNSTLRLTLSSRLHNAISSSDLLQ